MKKASFFVAIVLALVCLIGCTTVVPLCATGNAVGSKVGEATESFITVFAMPGSDGGIAKAAANGGIKKISTVDLKIFYVGNLYITITTVVTGE